MIIVNVVVQGHGWDPINYMVSLAAELLDAEVITVPADDPSRLARALAIPLGRRKNPTSRESCLLIGAVPSALVKIIAVDGWRSRFKSVAAWVIDSMWTGHIPRTIAMSNPFDHVFITTGEDLATWRSRLNCPVSWLPWGTDVLRLGTARPDRSWDLTRVGRQPPQWDDDAVTAAAAAQLEISFHPRPDASGLTQTENQKQLMTLYGKTKFLLAFSNSINREHYTHPTRQYLTGRWVDALASGAVVAGAAPRGDSIDTLLWPGATLELNTIERTAGFAVLQNALAAWTPAVAQRNHAISLQRLDWRWRFKTIADALGESSGRLETELEQLRAAIRASGHGE